MGISPVMRKTPNAAVVLFSTVAVAQGMPFHTVVASAKGAVEGFTKSLAAEFAPKVRVNCIAPSLTDTELAGDLLRDDKRREASAERHPLKRIGQREDIACCTISADEALFGLLVRSSMLMVGWRHQSLAHFFEDTFCILTGPKVV